jgi:spore maturation protein CgeB
MVERLNQLGVEHVYYLPLAVDAAFFSSKIEQSENLQKYKADVSFVGSFYANEQSYYELFNDDTYKNDRLKEPLNQIIKTGCFLYGKPYLEYLTQLLCQEDIWELFDYIEKATNIRLGQGYFSEQSDIILPSVIERKITVEERRLLMTAVAEEHWDFKLYTNSDLVAYPDCLKRANQGIVDYETEMPVVFHESKINLNVSLKSIHTGIPLRVLDIMASGGFVLSNRQTEIEEYFEIGREIAVFDSLSECLEQIRYYLSHDEERQQIAQAGQDKVKRLFRYEYLLGKMF